jgi:RNA polymerase sigma factor (sigma-70 family)
VHTTTQLAAEVMQHGAPGARVAHAALFERIVERMHRYFRRMIRDPHEAEECLQRCLVLLEQSLAERRYEPGRSFNTWMWLKARTVYAQWCRERERAPTQLADGDADVADPRSPQADVDRRLDATTLLEALARQLGPEPYEAFVLYYEGGLTQAEVAEALGRDRKTVARRIAEAHALIDRLVGGYDESKSDVPSGPPRADTQLE